MEASEAERDQFYADYKEGITRFKWDMVKRLCKFQICIPFNKVHRIIAGNFMILKHGKTYYRIKQDRPITIKDVIIYLTAHRIEPVGDHCFLEAILQQTKCPQIYKLFCGS